MRLTHHRERYKVLIADRHCQVRLLLTLREAWGPTLAAVGERVAAVVVVVVALGVVAVAVSSDIGKHFHL